MRKPMKKRLYFFFLFLLMICISGCRQSGEIEGYHIEYLNNAKEEIVKISYDPQNTELEALVEELLIMLWSDTESVEYRKPMPNDVELINYSLDGAMLTIWIDEDYYKMEQVERVLCCAAVVRTMTQIEGVDCVNFYVGDSPLKDSHGNLVGALYADSFVENPGKTINSIQNTTLTLYFSNKAGDALVAETRNVHYSSNMSMEKLIIEQLLEGPDTEGLKSAIPSGTKLVSVSTVDGTCYVNLDASFRNQDYTVKESIVFYSIINSLSEQSNITQVQISINGDTSGVYRDTYKLSDSYARNLDYVTTLEAGTTEDTEKADNQRDTESTENMTSEDETEDIKTTEEMTEPEKTKEQERKRITNHK